VSPRTAAVVTVGTELVSGLLVDTNTAEVALALARGGIRVLEAVSVADDRGILANTLRRLVVDVDLVVVTGGLGPTHDDVTREAAADALGLRLVRDEAIVAILERSAWRHNDPRANDQVFAQADVLEGARVLPAVKGTAPGQVVPTKRGELVLLPGPPRELRPLLDQLAGEWGAGATPPVVLRCTGVSESDVQITTQDTMAGRAGVDLTVLAAPGDVRVILFDRGIGAAGLCGLGDEVAAAIGSPCYSRDGASLAESVVGLARERGVTLATAESCTGGLVGAALTSVPGASDVFRGSVVAYANEAKAGLLDVPPGMLAQFGAVSQEVARAMAEGALAALGATLAVSVTGIAGPGGGSDDKPVGTVWFGTADASGSSAELRHFPGDREVVRTRATAVALDLLRRALLRS